MDVADITHLLEQLDIDIDHLENALDPLMGQNLSEVSAKLPLLDKSKLYVLVTYAIESILFSYLRLNGVKAKEHPVFQELTRVKQYFEKIKSVEAAGPKRENLSLDKQAAGRIIKHALAGNDAQDRRQAEMKTEERRRAHSKADALARKRKVDTNMEDSESTDNTNSESSTSNPSGSDIESAHESRRKRLKQQGAPTAEKLAREGGKAQPTGKGNKGAPSADSKPDPRAKKKTKRGNPFQSNG